MSTNTKSRIDFQNLYCLAFWWTALITNKQPLYEYFSFFLIFMSSKSLLSISEQVSIMRFIYLDSYFKEA